MLSSWQTLPGQPKKRAVRAHSLPRQGAGLRPSVSARLWVVTNCFCLELKQEVLWPWSCANLPGYKAIHQSGNITDICVCLRWHLLGLWTKYGANRYPNTSSGQWKKVQKCRTPPVSQWEHHSLIIPTTGRQPFLCRFWGGRRRRICLFRQPIPVEALSPGARTGNSQREESRTGIRRALGQRWLTAPWRGYVGNILLDIRKRSPISNRYHKVIAKESWEMTTFSVENITFTDNSIVT